MHPSLISLAFRRTLWPALLLGGLAVAWVLWSARAGGASELADWSHAPGVLRYSVWMTGLLVAGPLLIANAARVGHRLARSDALWCASRPTSRLSILASSWAGSALAACAWVLLLAGSAELGAGPDEASALQPVGSAALVAAESERAGVVTWQLQAPAHADARVLRVPVGLIAIDGPAAKVRARLSRGGGGPFTERELLIATRRPIEVTLPEGDGPLSLELERLGEGALVLVPATRAEWWRIAPGSSTASLLLFYRGALLACVLLAWAISLGVWMRPTAATTLILSVVVALWFSGGELGGWGALMDHVASGDLPGSPTLRGGLTAFAAWVMGTAVGWWGFRAGART